MSRDRESCMFPGNPLHGFSHQAARKIKFANPPRALETGCRKKERVDPYHNDHRTGFPTVQIFISLNSALFALRDIRKTGIFIHQLYTVSPTINPSFFRISGNNTVGSTDISSSVKFMMD